MVHFLAVLMRIRYRRECSMRTALPYREQARRVYYGAAFESERKILLKS